MATFRIGQRVRILEHAIPAHCRDLEGRIVGRGKNYPWVVNIPGHVGRLGSPHGVTGNRDDWSFNEDELAPITDPGFDTFMKRVVTPVPELQGLPLETP